LSSIEHLSDEIVIDAETGSLVWEPQILIEADESGQYIIGWGAEGRGFTQAFAVAWNIFEVIRIYRQLGTAQAISLLKHMLIHGILEGYSTREVWVGKALDMALSDTIADQLQVLLPDEIEVLLRYLNRQSDEDFVVGYNQLLSELADRPQRLAAQLHGLGDVIGEQGQPLLGEEEITELLKGEQPQIRKEILASIFHLGEQAERLPQFTRRLRGFKAERGL
jgi:hypothetical protein